VRADRLLSILLLLQAHGRLSAGALADRLEVSRRTIYRDLDSLGAAGVPVVTDRGPNGGASLLDGYRTDLTGMTEAELEVLLTFGGQAGPAGELGLRPELDQAARKLAVAAGHSRGGRLQERVLLDGERWTRTPPAPPHLARVQDALWSDRRLCLRYRRAVDRVVERVVEPYGLVCKAGVWYLLAGVGVQTRVYRVSRIEAAELTTETFERPPGFDLAAAWAGRVSGFRAVPPVRVIVRVDAGIGEPFLRLAGDHVVGRTEEGMAVLEFVCLDAAVGLLTSFGGAVEVLEPAELRTRLARAGRELVERYEDR
jgi:predicted DNA-binding transcriptional regulator YafY